MPRTIAIELNDADLQALAHDLLDPEQWIRDAVANKVAACKGRMVAVAVEVLSADPAVENMPAKPEKLIAELVKRPDYRNRKQRENDALAAAKA
jgi:hypothetical protein